MLVKEDVVVLRSTKPDDFGVFYTPNREYMQYLYLPVRFPAHLPSGGRLIMEPRLSFLRSLVDEALYREAELQGTYFLDRSYVYLTVKQTLVPVGMDQNRPGWHSDGFGTKDVQYIYFDSMPTEFLLGDIPVSIDDRQSMVDMQRFHEQNPDMVFQPEPNHLYRIDQNHVHRTVKAEADAVRLFVKITISDQIYAQQGNSVNYSAQYSWNYAPRLLERNQPHAK